MMYQATKPANQVISQTVEVIIAFSEPYLQRPSTGSMQFFVIFRSYRQLDWEKRECRALKPDLRYSRSNKWGLDCPTDVFRFTIVGCRDRLRRFRSIRLRRSAKVRTLATLRALLVGATLVF